MLAYQIRHHIKSVAAREVHPTNYAPGCNRGVFVAVYNSPSCFTHVL